MSDPRHIIPISGKDSLATALWQTKMKPGRPYEFMFNDVGLELPETYAWLDKVEAAQGWTIERVGKDLAAIMDGYDFLPSHKARYCTRQAKIEPMEAWIGDDAAVVYYGLRADEDRVGYNSTGADITPAYPLREAGLGLRGVWSILEAQDLVPPSFHWPTLYDRVCAMIGPEDEWGHLLKPWERRVAFAGRTRSNCFSCFYQRQYEYVWLAETHPDLFERTCTMEETTGGNDYTWRETYRLRTLTVRKDEIIERRARQVASSIVQKRQGALFDGDDGTRLSHTSCGLLCGK